MRNIYIIYFYITPLGEELVWSKANRKMYLPLAENEEERTKPVLVGIDQLEFQTVHVVEHKE